MSTAGAYLSFGRAFHCRISAGGWWLMSFSEELFLSGLIIPCQDLCSKLC